MTMPLFQNTLLAVRPPDYSMPHTKLCSRLSSLIALKAASLCKLVKEPLCSLSNSLPITRSLPPTMPSPSRSYEICGIYSVFLCINRPDLVFFSLFSLTLLHQSGTSKRNQLNLLTDAFNKLFVIKLMRSFRKAINIVTLIFMK